MYEQVFNFRSRPFTTTPFVKHYFAGATIQQSIGQAQLCIDRASGPVVLIGDIGTGKSLFLAMLEEHYKSFFSVVNLGCARLETRKDLLQSILFSLDRPIIGRTESELRFDLMAEVKPNEKCENGMLLLVDDAEALSTDLIDELRLITNYVVEGVPRVRLAMAGRQGLEELLTEPKVASFVQRIATRCYLSPLSGEETAAYVISHIDRVGGVGTEMFPADSLAKIHECTDGIPRLINQVADFALIIAGTRGAQTVSSTIIEEAWADVQSIPGMAAPPQESADPSGEKSDWTVIEFGSLADESDSDNGTIYEFGGVEETTETPAASQSNTIETGALQDDPLWPNSHTSEESGLPASIQNIIDDVNDFLPPADETPEVIELGPPVETPDDNTVEYVETLEHGDTFESVDQLHADSLYDISAEVAPQEPPANIDPEFGIDFSALQRMQQERQQQAQLHEQEEAGATAELGPETEFSAEFSAGATSDEHEDVARTGLSSVPDAEALERQKREMAAQFAAVFGKSPEKSDQNEDMLPDSQAEQLETTTEPESGFAPPIFTPEEQLANQELMDEQETLLNSVESSHSSHSYNALVDEEEQFDHAITTDAAESTFDSTPEPAFGPPSNFPNEAPVYPTENCESPTYEPMAAPEQLGKLEAEQSEATRPTQPDLPPLDVASFVRPTTTSSIVDQIADAYEHADNEDPSCSDFEPLDDQTNTNQIQFPSESSSADHLLETRLPDTLSGQANDDWLAWSDAFQSPVDDQFESVSSISDLEDSTSIPTEVTSASSDESSTVDAVNHPTNVDLVSPAPSPAETPPLGGFNIDQFTASIEAARAFDQTRSESDDPASNDSSHENAAAESSEFQPVQSDLRDTAFAGNDHLESSPSESYSSFAQHDDSLKESTDQHDGDPNAHETADHPTTSSSIEASHPASVPMQRGPSFDDPFAESFEQEENILDRFAPIIAAQNQSSTKLTSSDLIFVQPMDLAEPTLNAASEENPGDDESVAETHSASEFPTIEQPASEPAWSQATPSPEPPVESMFVEPTASDHSQTESTMSNEVQSEEPIFDELRPRGRAVIRPATILNQQALTENSSTDPLSLPTEEPTEPATPVEPYHSHVTEAANDEISRQADEILQRLNANRANRDTAVSHETEVNTDLEKTANLPQDGIRLQPELQSTENESIDDPSEQILHEIRQQHDMIRQSNETLSAGSEAPESGNQAGSHEGNHDEPMQVQPIEYPLRAPSESSETTDAHQDDAEMIIVPRRSEPTQPSLQQEPRIPLPETPVSKGQAERMDYQRLFDQLRNVNQQPNEQ